MHSKNIFVDKIRGAKDNIEALSEIEQEQKEKRDHAYQTLEQQKQQTTSPEVLKELSKVAVGEEFKLRLCSFITELTANQRDKEIKENREADNMNHHQSNKLFGGVANAQDSVSSHIRSELVPKQIKGDEDNAGNTESQCIAQDEPIIMVQPRGSMENDDMKNISMSSAKKSLDPSTSQTKSDKTKPIQQQSKIINGDDDVGHDKDGKD